ncbi:MAG TPA: ribosome biogenesis factor YjgA [Usitatibacter sp.]|nr:ribosome biogenesis factor YjgA [Usitatibacter sp.]
MDEDDFISKTQRKRRSTELQDLGAELVDLTPEQLRRLGLPETLLEAVLDCQGITRHEARRRQMQYIGKIMRGIDAAPIAEKLASLQAPSKKQTALFHLAEKWREEMLADASAVDRFERQFPHADVHKMRALVGAAKEERAAKRAPKHYRELFHALNAAIEQQAKAG